MIVGATLSQHYADDGIEVTEVPLSEKLCFVSSLTFYTGVIQLAFSVLRLR